MRYDASNLSLCFDSQAELEDLHNEMTALLREVTISVAKDAKVPAEGAARARQLLDQFQTFTRTLNALRGSLTPTKPDRNR